MRAAPSPGYGQAAVRQCSSHLGFKNLQAFRSWYRTCNRYAHERQHELVEHTPEVQLLTLDDAVSIAMRVHVCSRESDICAEGYDFEAKFNAQSREKSGQ